MGWIYINGSSNLRIFSFSEEVRELTRAIIDFAVNISPGVYILLLFSVMGLFILYLMYFIAKAIKQEDV